MYKMKNKKVPHYQYSSKIKFTYHRKRPTGYH